MDVVCFINSALLNMNNFFELLLPPPSIESFIRSCEWRNFMQFPFKQLRDKISWSDRRRVRAWSKDLSQTGSHSSSSALFWVLNLWKTWSPFRLRWCLCFVSIEEVIEEPSKLRIFGCLGFAVWEFGSSNPVALSCDSCGSECARACGTRHFRSCCFK